MIAGGTGATGVTGLQGATGETGETLGHIAFTMLKGSLCYCVYCYNVRL